MQLALIKVCGSFLFRQSKKTRGIFWSVRVISRVQKPTQILLVKGKFSFPSVNIWFDVTKCKFIVKYRSFKMYDAPLPIFVADIKITFVYNFAAPLNANILKPLMIEK